jgi:hypothetical protein
MQNIKRRLKMQLLKKMGFKSQRQKAKLMLSRKKRLEEKRRIIIHTDPVNLDQLRIKKEADPN